MDKQTTTEAAVAIVAIVVSGALVWGSSLDSSVFASVTTLCLGYVFGTNRRPNGNGTK